MGKCVMMGLRDACFALALCAGLSGCVSNQPVADTDPLERINRTFYDVNEKLDKVLKPVAQAYADVTPRPVRTSVTNFFDNASSLNTILNTLLQGKLLDTLASTGRFIVNSTFGVGGLFDPATKMGLTRREEDLGQTFGRYGAGEGAYMVLPLLGPSSLRDAPDIATSLLLSPFYYLTSAVTIPLGFVNAINTRANFLEATRVRDEAAIDPYTFTREAYRQRRNYDIYDGKPPSTGLDEFIEDENGAPAEPGGAVLKIQ